MELLPILTFITLGAVILFAVRSKMKTEEKLNKDNPTKSALARSKPDPKLQPDANVTDPYNVAGR